jgi:hypothetical protein
MKAYELIEKEENWCKGGSHKDDVNCALQAIGQVCFGTRKTTPKLLRKHGPAFTAACQKAARAMGAHKSTIAAANIIWFNDTHTHAEVYAALKEADV